VKFFSKNHRLVLLLLSSLGAAWIIPYAHSQIAVQNQGYLPYSDEPINYRSRALNDPVTRLQKQIDQGEIQLKYDPRFGYLQSVLENLRIPVSSQTLVFSKTSFQYKKISPQTPRALYFNDEVYVGFVHDGKALEVISFDPMQGAIFYLLDVHEAQHPVFQLRGSRWPREADSLRLRISGQRRVQHSTQRGIYSNDRTSAGRKQQRILVGRSFQDKRPIEAPGRRRNPSDRSFGGVASFTGSAEVTADG